MRFYANLDEKPCTLMFDIQTAFPKKMYIKVADSEKPNTIFTNRHCKVDSNEGILLGCPLLQKEPLLTSLAKKN